MIKFMLKQISPCSICHGCKVIQHPAWADFFKTHDILQSTEQADAWFSANYGYASAPDEEIECADCEGTGQIETEIDLREALSAIEAERERAEYLLFVPFKLGD